MRFLIFFGIEALRFFLEMILEKIVKIMGMTTIEKKRETSALSLSLWSLPFVFIFAIKNPTRSLWQKISSLVITLCMIS